MTGNDKNDETESLEIYSNEDSEEDFLESLSLEESFSSTESAGYDLEKLLSKFKLEQDVQERKRRLGQGGFGVVDLYEDPVSGRHTAHKRLRKEIRNEPDKLVNALREILITQSLEHPNIVSIHYRDFDEDGLPIAVMEAIPGMELSKIIEGLQDGEEEFDVYKPINKRLRMITDICNGMEYAHERSVIHRDIKPDNVMIGAKGITKVMDWGLAKFVNEIDPAIPEGRKVVVEDGAGKRKPMTIQVTIDDGTIKGTLEYMPPEQAHAEESHASDVYTIGTLMYELLALESFRAFEPGLTPLNKVTAITRNKGFVGFPGFKIREAKKVPKELRSIIMKALDPNLGKRYQSVKELREDIEAFMDDGEVKAHHYFPGIGKNILRVKRNPVKAAVIGLAALGFGIGIPSYQRSIEAERARTAQKAQEAAEADAREKATRLEVAEAKNKRSDALVPCWKATQIINVGGDLQEAESKLHTSISIDPVWGEPHYQLGRLHYERRDFRKALRELELANKLNIKETEKRDASNSIIEKGKIDVRALFTAGIVSIDIAGNPKVANKYLEQIINETQSEPRPDNYTFLARSIVAFNDDDVDSAIANARQVVGSGVRMSEAYFLLSTYHSWGLLTPFNHEKLKPYQDFPKALSLLDKAIEFDPRLRYFLQRSLVHNALRNYDEAIEDVDKVLNAGIHIQTAYFSKAQALQNKGNSRRDLSFHKKALDVLNEGERRMNGLRADNLAMRGLVYVNFGRSAAAKKDNAVAANNYKLAIKNLTDAVSQTETSRNRFWRGIAFESQASIEPADAGRKTLEEAVRNYDRAIFLDKDIHQARERRAHCYELLGKFDDAVVDYISLARKGFYSGYFHAGRALIRLGRTDEAVNALDKYLASGHTQYKTQAQQLLSRLK